MLGRGSTRTAALAASHHVPAFATVEQAISERPAVVAISASAAAHPPLVRAFLEAGCHVLCSHPVAADVTTVRDLGALADRRGLVLATDYSLRLTPEFARLSRELSRGGLLRIAAEAPSRALVVSLDLAIALAGPVERVFASARYPSALDERRRAAPSSFAPSVLLEHTQGVVTSIVPVPHASSTSCHRLTVSLAHRRLDMRLPSGGLTRTTRHAGTEAIESTLVSSPGDAPADPFGHAMEQLVIAFIAAIVANAPPHAPWVEEARVRASWEAVVTSTRSREPVRVTD